MTSALSVEARSKKFGAAEGEGIVRCDACPVLCRIRVGRAGACSRYANEDGHLVRVDPVVVLQRTVDEGGRLVEFAAGEWDGRLLDPSRTFVTGIGAGTTYPDYKPAPFIVSAEHEGVDAVTVVTEGIFSYCGVKVKIDTDRHLGPETGANPCRGRGGRPRDDRRIRLADALGRWRPAPDRWVEIGRQGHLRHVAQTLRRRRGDAFDRRRTRGGRGSRQGAGRRWTARGADARRLRLGDRRHIRSAMVRRGGRGDRGGRSHHRRPDRASGRARAWHAACRHPRARAGAPRRADTSRSPIPASAGAGPISRIRSRSSRRSTRDCVAGTAAAPHLDDRRGRTLSAYSTRTFGRCRQRCRPRCARWSTASARTASRRSRR